MTFPILLISPDWEAPFRYINGDGGKYTLPSVAKITTTALSALSTISLFGAVGALCLSTTTTLTTVLPFAIVTAMAVATFSLYTFAVLAKTTTSEVQVDSSTATNSPENVGMVCLPNVGNACWLNTVLQFLASTEAYDGIFDIEVLNDPSLREAQTKLQQVVQAIRERNAPPRNTLLELRELMSRHILRQQVGLPQSAEEFFSLLLDRFEFSSEDTTASPFNVGATRTICSIAITEAQYQGTDAINLAQMIQDQLGDQFTPPRVLTLSLQRQISLTRHCRKSIVLNQGTFSFTLENNPSQLYCYRLESAMHNTGGHWVEYEFSEEGKMIVHDDSRVYQEQNLENAAKADFFRFRLLEEDREFNTGFA